MTATKTEAGDTECHSHPAGREGCCRTTSYEGWPGQTRYCASAKSLPNSSMGEGGNVCLYSIEQCWQQHTHAASGVPSIGVGPQHANATAWPKRAAASCAAAATPHVSRVADGNFAEHTACFHTNTQAGLRRRRQSRLGAVIYPRGLKWVAVFRPCGSQGSLPYDICMFL